MLCNEGQDQSGGDEFGSERVTQPRVTMNRRVDLRGDGNRSLAERLLQFLVQVRDLGSMARETGNGG